MNSKVLQFHKTIEIEKKLNHIDYHLRLFNDKFTVLIDRLDDSLILQTWFNPENSVAVCLASVDNIFLEKYPIELIIDGSFVMEIVFSKTGQYTFENPNSVNRSDLEKILAQIDFLLENFDKNAKTIKRIK